MNTNDSLAPKVFKSGFWVFLLRIMSRLFEFIRTVVLARLLAPEDFGLFGIALLSLSILQKFTQTGFGAALIQKKKEIKPYLDTVWTVNLFKNTVFALILFIAAPLVGIFFNEPKAILLVKVLSITAFLGGLANIGTIYFRKEIEFHKLVKLQISTSITDMVVAITAAVYLRNVWALVYGFIAARIVGIFVSYKIHPYRPHFDFDLKKAKELFGFGKWVLGSSVLSFLITQGDDIFVGKLLGVAALGFYQMAYRLSNMPATEITHLISQVTFPAYSKMQDDIPRLRESYLRVVQFIAFLTFPLAGAIFVLAPDFTKIFLGEKWMAIVPVLQILVFAGLLRSIMATTGPIFLSVGKPKIETKWQVIQFSVLIVLIYGFTVKWGIAGTALAVVFSTAVSTIGFISEAVKILKFKLNKFNKVILIPCINGLCILILITLLKTTVANVGICEFIICIIAGILTLIGLTVVFDKFFNYKMVILIKELFNNLKGDCRA